ncbi:hypothetical protein EDB80DRAFT_546893, partial [Ilyonectria destructans]
GGAARSDSSLVQEMLQTMLQTMLHETSSHLMSKQKQMLERLWDALMENHQKATKVMSDQVEMIRQLQTEIRTTRAEAAEERKRTEELRRMHEQTADQLRAMREQGAEDRKQLRK